MRKLWLHESDAFSLSFLPSHFLCPPMLWLLAIPRALLRVVWNGKGSGVLIGLRGSEDAASSGIYRVIKVHYVDLDDLGGWSYNV